MSGWLKEGGRALRFVCLSCCLDVKRCSQGKSFSARGTQVERCLPEHLGFHVLKHFMGEDLGPSGFHLGDVDMGPIVVRETGVCNDSGCHWPDSDDPVW